MNDHSQMAGKTKLTHPTRELLRFVELMDDLEKDGVTQAELSRRTGMKQSYLSALKRWESTGAKGIGAEIVRIMHDRMGIGSDYFYDADTVHTRYTDYTLSSRRDQRDMAKMQAELADLRLAVKALATQFAQSEEAHERKERELERQLAAARGPRPRPVR